MINRLLEKPMELWLGMVALISGVAMQNNTLLIMSVVLLGTAKILSEMKNK